MFRAGGGRRRARSGPSGILAGVAKASSHAQSHGTKSGNARERADVAQRSFGRGLTPAAVNIKTPRRTGAFDSLAVACDLTNPWD